MRRLAAQESSHPTGVIVADKSRDATRPVARPERSDGRGERPVDPATPLVAHGQQSAPVREWQLPINSAAAKAGADRRRLWLSAGMTCYEIYIAQPFTTCR
jgi:hypothetical protein